MLNEIIKFGKKLTEQGLNSSIAGNISVLENENILITKTGTMLDELSIDDIAKIPFNLQDISEIQSKKPSTEFFMHKYIYQNSDKAAVIHSHSPFAIIISILVSADYFEPKDSENSCYLKRINIVNGEPGSIELANNVSRVLEDNHTCLIKGHGVVCAGKSLKEAFSYLCLTELACKIKYFCER